jgi:hypothetical protein
MPKPDAKKVKGDAKGQFHRGKKGRKNSGLVSAEPRILGDGEKEAPAWNEGEENQQDVSLAKREM